MLVRVIDYTIDDGRQNATGYRLFTTLLDPAEVPTVDLAAAYQLAAGQLNVEPMITHRFALADFMAAYEAQIRRLKTGH